MPELPEVETIVRGLRRLVSGKRIARFESLWERVTEPERAEVVARRVVGARIVAARRRGKFAILELDTGEALVVSLRMTGRLLFRAAGAKEDPFLRARISFSGGDELRFTDVRKFGRIRAVPATSIANGDGPQPKTGPLHERLGPEPLARSFTIERFASLLRSRPRSRLKPLLLDQAFVAGMGNIYANEALFRARLHPLRTAGSLRRREIEGLHGAIQDTLRYAIRRRGASIDDYRDARGRRGRMHREFVVHGREDEPCLRCGSPIRKTWVGGRGTYWCARCQRAPAAGRH